jgi:hypothetical protein
MDIIGHLDTPDAPYTAAIGVKTIDGTQRQYVGQVTIDADAVFQRVHLVIPEDGTAIIEPGTDSAFRITVSLYGGANRHANNNTWEASVVQQASTSGSQNWASATGNYLGITNVKLQPGQIATPYIPRTYAEELDICKYYFEKLGDGTAGENYVNGANVTTSSAHCILRYSEKRATPAVSVSSAAHFRMLTAGGADNEVTGITLATPTATSVDLNSSGASTLVAGDATTLRDDGGGNSYILINAES